MQEPKWKKVEAGLYEADMGDGFTIRCTKYPSDDHGHWGYQYWSYEVIDWMSVPVITHSPNGEYEPTLKDCKRWALIRYELEASKYKEGVTN